MEILKAVAVIGAGLLVGCGASSPSPVGPGPSPSPTPTGPPGVVEVPGVVRGTADGSTTLWLTEADPMPGATLAGCGGGASGCAGRIRMTFHIVSPAGGPALGLVAYLHSDRVVACFVGRVGSFVLTPGGQDIGVLFEPADTDAVCPTPLDITHVAAVLEGPGSVYGRQEWAATYHLVR